MNNRQEKPSLQPLPKPAMAPEGPRLVRPWNVARSYSESPVRVMEKPHLIELLVQSRTFLKA